MPQCSAGTNYTVRAGDSLWLISRNFNTTVQDIESANPGIDFNNLYVGQQIRISRKDCPTGGENISLCISKAEQTLREYIRLLWEQHVYWTRFFIISSAFDLPDIDFVTNRLLRNPKDFGAMMRAFYGDNIAAGFEELLTSHLTIAAELVNAAKAGDSAAAEDSERRWYANADQIAAFLADINPYWSFQEWQRMLYDHLAMTKEEAVDILTRRYEEGINIFGNIEKQSLEMADFMTNGLTNQFSQYFKI